MPRHSTKDPTDRQEDAQLGPTRSMPTAHSFRLPPASQVIDPVFAFLKEMLTTVTATEWIAAFSSLLTSVFDDIDNVVVRVNLHCRLVNPADVSMEDPRTPTAVLAGALANQAEELGNVELYIEGPPYNPEAYQTPFLLRYTCGADELGTLAFFRRRGKGWISEETQTTLREMEPFLKVVLTDLVARHAYAKPLSRVFHNVLRAIAADTRLTNRELQVLTLHMFGRKYAEIARRLYISIDTVKKHVKKIHRKTNARSATELFARYFTPLIDIDEPPE